MTIIEALKQLRNDLRAWVAINLEAVWATLNKTVLKVKMNNSEKTPTNGVIELGTVVVSGQMDSSIEAPYVLNGTLMIPTTAGEPGDNGATFIPSVDSDGDLSWTNDKNLDNPTSVNIKGPNGDAVSGVTSGSSSDSDGYTNTPITFTVGTTQLNPVTVKAKHGYTPVKGVDYSDGDNGKSISSVTLKSGSSASGTTDVYSVKVDTTEVGTFNVYQGKDFKYSDFTAEQLSALQGPKGTGISSITGPVSNGKIDTYTIHYTDGLTSSFTVTNGSDGTGVTILGNYETETALKTKHPTGDLGDAYLVSGDLYVWSQTKNDWVNVGNIQGPKGELGIQGEQGPIGPEGPLGPEGPKGDKGDKGDLGIQGILGPKGDSGNNGSDGATFTPAVSAAGVISWSNDKGLTNPASVNIKGPQGILGPNGEDGREITSITSDATELGGYTSTKVIVAFDRGDSAEFIVNAKNGSNAAVPSNIITGSGTDGYLAKFTGTNTVGNGIALSEISTKSDLSDYLPLSGGTMTGNIDFTSGSILFGGGQSGSISIPEQGVLLLECGGDSVQLGNEFLISDVSVRAPKFINTSSSDSYVLLGGGGTKLLSDITAGYATEDDLTAYLPLTGGTLTGNLNLSNGLLFFGDEGTIQTDDIAMTLLAPSMIDLYAPTTMAFEILADSFVKIDSSDSYVLLGGGGTKAISDFALASSLEDYLPLTGGTMTGDIIMGSGGPNIQFEEGGSIYSNGLVSVAGNILIEGNAQAIAFYETSDIRKKDIKSDLSLDKCYDLIDKCQTVIYSLKDQTKEQVGMIAQEIEEFFPEVVATDEDGFKSLAYDRLVVICFKVLKDVIKRLEKLENGL